MRHSTGVFKRLKYDASRMRNSSKKLKELSEWDVLLPNWTDWNNKHYIITYLLINHQYFMTDYEFFCNYANA